MVEILVVVVVVVVVVVLVIIATVLTVAIVAVRKKRRNFQTRVVGGSSQIESQRPHHQSLSRVLEDRSVSSRFLCKRTFDLMLRNCFVYVLGPPVQTEEHLADFVEAFLSNMSCCSQEMKVVNAIGPIAISQLPTPGIGPPRRHGVGWDFAIFGLSNFNGEADNCLTLLRSSREITTTSATSEANDEIPIKNTTIN